MPSRTRTNALRAQARADSDNRSKTNIKRTARPARQGAQRASTTRTSRTGPSRKALLIAGALVALSGLTLGLTLGLGGSVPAKGNSIGGPPGPEGIPLEEGTPLAPVTTSATGQTVNGVQCEASEQVAFHIHTHLAVYVNGVLRPIPAGIGIVEPAAQQTAEGPFYEATRCYYWLHVHAQDGVIHIESPTVRGYTLGDFFAIWGQPLSSTEVGQANGKLTVFVNGSPYHGYPAAIALGSHEDVQIDVGQPVVPPKTVDWTGTGL